ncbi:MAG: hypothetical protein N2422_08470 [Rhodobacteraceae bacterium]|nr:hypothetical protein [Paracoccaceae bacterium]
MGGNTTLVPGATLRRAGFFTRAGFLRGVVPAEVERRLGYRAGRLAQGWWLLVLTEMPGPADFELRGYSQMSGGVAQGHLPQPPDPRTAEARLGAEGFDLGRIKAGLIRDTFRLAGPDRLAKVVPVAGETGEADYPPGSGIPQWTLTRPLAWSVAAFVAPGRVWMGEMR